MDGLENECSICLIQLVTNDICGDMRFDLLFYSPLGGLEPKVPKIRVVGDILDVVIFMEAFC